jgi:hypothetical protein
MIYKVEASDPDLLLRFLGRCVSKDSKLVRIYGIIL